MRPLAKAVVKTGLVSKGALDEMKRWGLPVEVEEEEIEPITDLDQVVHIVRMALEGSEQVRIQESDLDVLRSFLDPEQQYIGELVVKVDGRTSSFPVRFCETRMGEYAIPWKSENIRDTILLGGVDLVFWQGSTKKSVPLLDVRESYLGQQRAFMICTPEMPNGDR